MGHLQGTTPSALWVKDLDALGDVLDEIAEAGRKQDVEDAKQRKLAGKRKVLYTVEYSAVLVDIFVALLSWWAWYRGWFYRECMVLFWYDSSCCCLW